MWILGVFLLAGLMHPFLAIPQPSAICPFYRQRLTSVQGLDTPSSYFRPRRSGVQPPFKSLR
jgi:hypothetical protein